ncbi:hypothetical protein GH714_000733 [Hevea brasiliensis]|uniref:DEK-C domain-containing protein n=1 Tax=Hevea brasiliensis TaxID=3981 RepID=A0A6A6LMM0_HEVBR|nr:hypothetical protein GH714_000733 [Hevea brasiliensis]
MASETLEEKKSEAEAPVQEKEESKPEEEREQPKDTQMREDEGNSEAQGNENEESGDKQVEEIEKDEVKVEGRGTQLKDIPNVAFKLSKRKPDDNLQMLHTILFGKKAKAHNLKKNIGQFSGYVWAENEEKQKAKVREKLDRCFKEKLVDFCDVLNIPISKTVVKKEELTVKLLEFLESPHATTDVLLADKEQKGKKRKVTMGKNATPGEASVTPAKKQRRTSQTREKLKQSSKGDDDEDEDKVESPDAKDAKNDSQDDDGDENETMPKEESDHEESKSGEEEDEPKEQMSTPKASKKNEKESSGAKSKDKLTLGKKSTQAKPIKSPSKSTKKSSKQGAADTDGTSFSQSKSKGSTSKKQKVEKESPTDRSAPSKNKGSSKKLLGKLPLNASAKDQGKAKSGRKAKAEPSREDMHAVVVDILKEVDFNTATLSDILRQLGTHFNVDLMHRKAEVKDIITEKEFDILLPIAAYHAVNGHISSILDATIIVLQEQNVLVNSHNLMIAENFRDREIAFGLPWRCWDPHPVAK